MLSVHVPTARADTTPDVIEQLAVPLDTVDVTEPEPEPPMTDKMIPV
jgi:hypothetical protein